MPVTVTINDVFIKAGSVAFRLKKPDNASITIHDGEGDGKVIE